MEMTNTVSSLKYGMIGAASLNVIHEAARHLVPNAPHVDQIAMRAIGRYFLKPLGVQVSLKTLRRMALAGDLISNSLYYAGILFLFERRDAKSVWKRAGILGLAAGIGAVVLPPYMRLGQQPSRNFPVTASLTVTWYLLGALATAAAYTAFGRSRSER